jgi:TonB family protein
MKGLSLQKTAAVSAALHLTALLLAALAMKHSNAIVVPSPYTVSLVGPARTTAEEPLKHASESGQTETRSVEPGMQIERKRADVTTDQKRVEERLSEIASKKKIERIVKLRSIVSIGRSDAKPVGKSSSAQASGGGSAKGTIFDSYYARITSQIRQEWVFPDTGDRNLEAVVAVKILKDGEINVQGIEKSSGNLLFDRSALRALAKASPVASPPYEMEIGIRFFP